MADDVVRGSVVSHEVVLCHVDVMICHDLSWHFTQLPAV